MQLSQEDRAYVTSEAKRLGIEAGTLLAVIEVESAGKIYERVNGENLPLIRFEGHYFDRYLTGAKREEARKQGLASPIAGAIKNPSLQSQRYAMLAQAMRIDRDAALMSISIGIGQVMVAHWKTLGYLSPDHMFKQVTRGFQGQLDAMTAYIVQFGLVDELQRHDWAGFARGYNGPAYAKYGYHTKLAAAYRKYAGKDAPTSPASGMLRMGSKGARVRELQQLLVRAGHSIKVDGDYGPSTRDAVRSFQIARGLTVDGIAGPETMKAIEVHRIAPDENPGKLGILEVDETKAGGSTSAVGVGVSLAAEKLDGIAEKIGGTGLEWLSYASAALYAVSGLLVVGGLLWAAYGYVKAQRTYEGVS